MGLNAPGNYLPAPSEQAEPCSDSHRVLVMFVVALLGKEDLSFEPRTQLKADMEGWFCNPSPVEEETGRFLALLTSPLRGPHVKMKDCTSKNKVESDRGRLQRST